MGKEKVLTAEQEAAKKAKEAEVTAKQNEADAVNAKRSGKGTRVAVGMTRGKNPKVISWDEFDTDLPETLPESITEFYELVGKPEEKIMVSYLIEGFNDLAYSAASDVLSEFVEPNWPPQVAKQFKMVISNYVAGTGVSVEEAVELMKPGFSKAFTARLAAASANAA